MMDLNKVKEVVDYLDELPRLRVKMHDIQSHEDLVALDILHKIEMDELSVKQKREAVDILKASRLRRREAKDLMVQLDLILEYMDETRFDQKRLNKLYGQLAHKQEVQNNRKYTDRTTVGELLEV